MRTIFDTLKMKNTYETDVAIGDDNFNLNPFNIGDTPLYGIQRYLVKDTTNNECYLSGINKWVNNELLTK